MQSTSLALLIEAQLNITSRLILGLSASITSDELQSIRRCLARMDQDISRALTAKALEAEGVASIGNASFPPVHYVH
jgi:hypothetical protein